MSRQKDILIEENGRSVKEVLSQDCGLSRRQISRLKSSGGLLVNGKPTVLTYELSSGDRLSIIFTDRDEAKAQIIAMDPQILYEDDYLIIADKPAFMPCHPSFEHPSDDLETLLEKTRGGKLYPVGRLDKNVTGIMIYAKDARTASDLSFERQNGELRKIYHGIVSGRPQASQGTLNYMLTHDPKKRRMRASSEGKPCVTDYRVLKEFEYYSLIEITIHTGRTHQIRAGFTAFGYPLLGDAVYKGDRSFINRPALHCAYLSLVHPRNEETLRITADYPPDMKRLLDEKTEDVFR